MPVVNNCEALLYIANQNCIEYHVLPVPADDLWHPDRMIFDLDPSTEDFDEVREASMWLHDLLDELGLTAFVMTSGSRGLHIWVPLDGSATVEDVEHVRERRRRPDRGAAPRRPHDGVPQGEAQRPDLRRRRTQRARPARRRAVLAAREGRRTRRDADRLGRARRPEARRRRGTRCTTVPIDRRGARRSAGRACGSGRSRSRRRRREARAVGRRLGRLCIVRRSLY